MMKNSLSFSILIANYNNGKYLMDAVESVRQQTYTNWEMFLAADIPIYANENSVRSYRNREGIKIFNSVSEII